MNWGDDGRLYFLIRASSGLAGLRLRVAVSAARAALVHRFVRLESQLARVRACRDELAPRRASLWDERLRLLG